MPKNILDTHIDLIRKGFAMPKNEASGSASALPAFVTPERVAIMCALATLDIVVDNNNSATDETKVRAVPLPSIAAAFDGLGDEFMAWLSSTSPADKNKSANVRDAKKTGASQKIICGRLLGAAGLWFNLLYKKAAIVAGLKPLVHGFSVWYSTYRTIHEGDEFDIDEIGDLIMKARRMKSNLGDKSPGLRLFQQIANEPVIETGGESHMFNDEDDEPKIKGPLNTLEPAPKEPEAYFPKPLLAPDVAKNADPDQYRLVPGTGKAVVVQGRFGQSPWQNMHNAKDVEGASTWLQRKKVPSTVVMDLIATLPKPATDKHPPVRLSKMTVGEIAKKYSVDPQQAEIIASDAPFQVIPAAAGSGKTRTVTRKIQRLVDEGVPPSQIKIMAFNKHAAIEIQERLKGLIGDDRAGRYGVNPQTTHSFCLNHMKGWSEMHKQALAAKVVGSTSFVGSLRLPGKGQMLRPSFDEALKRLGLMVEDEDGELKRPKSEDIGVDLRTLAMYIDKGKNEGLTLTEFMEQEWPKREDQRVKILMAGVLLYEEQKGLIAREKSRYGAKFQDMYEFFLPASGAGQSDETEWKDQVDSALGKTGGEEGVEARFDFTDMLCEFLVGITPKEYDDAGRIAEKQRRVQELRDKYRYWIIDEAQDLSTVQHRIYDLIAGGRKQGDGQYMLVGDDAQSIYAFRGAQPEDFVNRANATGTARLDIATNYRSRSEIVKAADKLINNNQVQLAKDTKAAQPSGGILETVVAPDYETAANTIADDVAAKVKSGYRTESGTPKCAIICRTNKELNAFEDELALRDIAYVRRAGIPFWLKDDVGAVTALLALAFCRAGKMKLSRDQQLEYLGRAYKFPNRPGSPGANSGKTGKFYLEPIASANDPLKKLDQVNASDIISKRHTEVGGYVVRFNNDLNLVASQANKGLAAMFDAMLRMKSRGFDKSTFADLVLQKNIGDEGDSDLQETAADEGSEATDTSEGAAVFGKIVRFQEYNQYTDPSVLIGKMVEATDRCARMGDKIKNKDDPNLAAVTLSTVHMTKGLEYENVYMVMNAGKFPSPVFPTDDLLANAARVAQYPGEAPEQKLAAMKIEEERRLAYVGVTRAVERCVIYTTKKMQDGTEAAPSQFITELGLEIKAEIKESVQSTLPHVDLPSLPADNGIKP